MTVRKFSGNGDEAAGLQSSVAWISNRPDFEGAATAENASDPISWTLCEVRNVVFTWGGGNIMLPKSAPKAELWSF